MSQVSKTHLEATIQKELYDQFSFIISELKSSTEVEDFFSEFLTRTERIMLSKRLGIAVLLTKGYTYRDTRHVLHVSFPTIRSVQFWLDHGGKGYKAAVEKIVSRQTLAAFFEKIDTLIDHRPII